MATDKQCQEKDCDQYVSYVRTPKPGGFGFELRDASKRADGAAADDEHPHSVALTCSNGHTHIYYFP